MGKFVEAARDILHWGLARRFIRFIAVGGVGAVLNLSILYFLTTNGLHYLLSGAIAIEFAFIFNFFGNKAWTFGDIEFEQASEVLSALLRDHGVRLGGMAVNLVLLWFLTDVVGIYYVISQVIGAGVASVWNFAGNLLWTWGLH